MNDDMNTPVDPMAPKDAVEETPVSADAEMEAEVGAEEVAAEAETPAVEEVKAEGSDEEAAA